MNEIRDGGCACGAVRYRLEGEPVALAVCHCADCQRQSGSAFSMSLIMPEASVRLLSGTLESFTRIAESGRPVECFFCGACGARIYNRPSSMKGTLNVKPGTLDDTSWLEPVLHVWTSSKQPWVLIPEGVRVLEGQP